MKQITIEIDTDGQVSIETTGFKGNACEKATAEMERALGVAGKRQRKPEYYQTTSTTQRT